MALKWLRQGIRRFVTAVEEERLVAAIREAEKGNRGEVRVHIEARCKGDPLERAAFLFGELHMEQVSVANALSSRRASVASSKDRVWTMWNVSSIAAMISSTRVFHFDLRVSLAVTLVNNSRTRR